MMTDRFMTDDVLLEKYGLEVNADWNREFSAVSLENLLFYKVANCINTFEQILESVQSEITTIVENNHFGVAEWYNRKAREFQSGDELVLINGFPGYAEIDVTKQIVKYSATEPGETILVKVAGEQNGELAVIPNTANEPHIDRLQHYFNRIKPAGTHVVVKSAPADKIILNCEIFLNPLLFHNNGELIIGGGTPIKDAINSYLKGIEFNGVFVKQRLIDAIQAVRGVTDVANIEIKSQYGDYDAQTIERLYKSYAGWFLLDEQNSNIQFQYETQLW